MSEKLIAVYGSLRKGMHNNYILGESKYIGNFNSEPSFSMYSVRGDYPAVIKEGSTSISIEIFEANENIQQKLDRLEGYDKDLDEKYNYYNKEVIETPYGDAFIYYFNSDLSDFEKVDSGDWVLFKEKELKNTLNIFNEWAD